MKKCGPDQVLLFHLGHLNKVLYKRANRYFTASGLPIRVEQLPVLMILHHKGRQSQQDLAFELGRDKASVQRTVQFLHKHDYIRIEADPHDGRKNMVNLTEHGCMISARVQALIIRIDKILFSAIAGKEKEKLIGLMDKLTKRIENFKPIG